MEYVEQYLKQPDEIAGNTALLSVLICQEKNFVKNANVSYVEIHTYEAENLNTVVESAGHINIIIYKKRISVNDVEENSYELVGLDIVQMNVNLNDVRYI